MSERQAGFAHIGTFLLAAFVFLVAGFACWRAYSNSKNKTTAPSSINTSPTSSTQRKAEVSPAKDGSKMPEGYVVYENKDVGFKFAYPNDWRTIVRTGDDNPALITNGLNGHSLRTMFKDGDINVLPRGNYLSGDTGPAIDEGHYSGGYLQKNGQYHSIARYTAEEVQIPEERIMAKVQSGLGTVLIINAGTIAGNRIQLLLNLPIGKPLSGLDLVFKNSNEDFADESNIDAAGHESLKVVAGTFEAL